MSLYLTKSINSSNKSIEILLKERSDAKKSATCVMSSSSMNYTTNIAVSLLVS